MKALKGKTLMSLIYAMCLSIPLVSILSRVIYVQTNKNAYQSYSGKQEEYSETPITSLKLNEIYHFDSQVSFTNTTTQNTGVFGVEDLTNIYSVNSGLLNNASNIKYLQFYYSSSNCALYYYDANQSNLGSMNTTAYPIQFDFRLVSYNTSTFINYSMLFKLDINDESHLDNVFDYSVSKLVDENNFGQLNFFSWFDNLLLTDAQQNMLYVRFVNWYLNYAMLVSLMQILFLCLMWFVNFSRKLLDRGMNYDW